MGTNEVRNRAQSKKMMQHDALEIDNDNLSSSARDPKEHKSICPRSYVRRRQLTYLGIFSILLVTVVLAYNGAVGGAGSFLGTDATQGMSAMVATGRRLSMASWNIAAINNNPFEYWLTMENPAYEKLMVDVEHFLEEPGDRDIPVKDVFNEQFFGELDAVMDKSVKKWWDEEYKDRLIVSQFLKDPLLGKKRLISMPDRVTNTISVVGSDEPVCRPTVINGYTGDLSTMDKWWAEWKKFHTETPLQISTKEGVKKMMVTEMLQPIKKSKYPEITTEEEAMSLQLQLVCSAIFDAIMVHMMNTVSTPDVWQPLKQTIVDSLIKKKVPQTLEILEKKYGDMDIIALQEVSSSLINRAREGPLGKKFHIVAPGAISATRDQNSVLFLKKTTFPGGAIKEITPLVEAAFPEGVKVPVAPGDILAITTQHVDGVPFVLASFHGDTNGLATNPVLDALVQAMSNDSKLANHRLIFGLDANTYEKAIPKKQQDVMDFGVRYRSHGLTSCWGDIPNPQNYTTYNARTYLQPQLNKACKSTEKREKGDVNPKDFIVFPKTDFEVIKTWKDNTGEERYLEDTPFPTLEFPSDHGILATILKPKDSAS